MSVKSRYIFFIILLISFHSSQAVAQSAYQPHQIINAGNGLKIEILTCRGSGDSAECNVIYYTDKRQNGKRVWEKTMRLKEQEIAAKKVIQKSTATLPVNPASQAILPQKKLAPATAALVVKKQHTTKTESAANSISKKNNRTTPASSKSKSIENPQEIMVDSLGITKDTSAVVKQMITGDAKSSTTIPAGNAYDLQALYAIALSNNVAIQQAANNISVYELQRKSAQFNLLPSMYYSVGHYFAFGKNIDPVTNSFVTESFSGGYTSLNLQQDIFAGFTRINTIKQSAYLLEAASFAKKKAALEVLANITVLYAKLQHDKEQLLLSQANMLAIKRDIAVVDEKIKVGRVTKYEAYSFNGRYYTEEARHISLRHDSIATAQALAGILNLPVNQPIPIAQIDSNAMQHILTAPVSFDELYNNALSTHPAIKQAELEEKAARLEEKIAKGALYPSLYVGGNVVSNYNADNTNAAGDKIPLTTQLNNNLGQNINIGLRVPIFSQMQTANKIKQQKINIANAGLAVETAKREVIANTLQLTNDFTAARQGYKASANAYEQQTLSYELYAEKYRLGQISSVELLTARDILQTAASQFVQAKLQVYFQYQLIDLLKRN